MPSHNRGKIVLAGKAHKAKKFTTRYNIPMRSYRKVILHSGRSRIVQVVMESTVPDFSKGRVVLLDKNKRVARANYEDVSLSTFYGKKTFYLNNIKVSDGYREEGFCRQLISEIGSVAKSRGGNSLTLHVEKENTAAQAVYEKIGFKKIHESANIQADGKPVFSMRLAL